VPGLRQFCSAQDGKLQRYVNISRSYNAAMDKIGWIREDVKMASIAKEMFLLAE
jgi:hypothetical protein